MKEEKDVNGQNRIETAGVLFIAGFFILAAGKESAAPVEKVAE